MVVGPCGTLTFARVPALKEGSSPECVEHEAFPRPMSTKSRRAKVAAKKTGRKLAARDTVVGRATPERLAKPLTDARDGQDGVQRITDSPLAWLAARGFLNRLDGHLNRLLFEAGEEYRRHWYLSGLSPIAAVDPTRPGSTSGPADRLPASERQAWHRRAYRDGELSLGPYFSVVVNAVVLEERGLEDIGRQVSGYADPKANRIVALDRLVEGLRRLGIEYGFVART